MTLLPPDVPVSKLLPFLSSAVRHTEAMRRNNQVHVMRACVIGVSQKKVDEGVVFLVFRALRCCRRGRLCL